MAKQRVNVAILDRVDGMPAMILANGNWGQWSNELKKYVDTGVRSYPEDDANNIKYFKLTNTSEAPMAPTQTGGWGSLEALNKALGTAGWSEDPKSVSESARFQWMAVYSKENIPQPDADTGTMKFVPRYTYSVTGLFNNFAPSPTVSFDAEKQVITITNPNGSSVAVKIPTPEAVKALSDMVAGLKKQVDKAVYSYEGSGAPTMDGTIVKDWLEGDNGEPITDDKTKADIFATHVGDAYFDKEGNTAYRFTLRTGGDPSNPADYGWEVVKDNALSSAIAKIAEMEGETVKIWTETPTSGDSYKVGDILIYKQGTEWRYKHCVKANTPPQYLYSDTDWVEPYATVAEVKELREKLGALSSDLQTATGNIADLKKETEDIKGAWIEGIKDGIISEQERANLNDTSKRIDEEQAQLKSNVDYILGSPYFADKEDFKVAADAVIASDTGSIDKLQKAIADAIADSKITKEEREAVTQAFAAYDTTREALLKAIKDAKSEIDKQIPASVQVGGRNYAANKYQPSLYKIKPYHYRWSGDKSVQILIISDITNVTVEEGDEFTLSFLLDCDDIGQPQWRVRLSVGTKTISYLPPASTEDKGGLKKYAFNFRIGDYKQIPNVQVYSHNFSPDGDNGNYISHKYLEVRDIMLERGTVATDWTPAPEDIQAETDEAKRLADVAQKKAIAEAKKAYDDAIAKAKELDDSLKIGGRNLLIASNWNGRLMSNNVSEFPITQGVDEQGSYFTKTDAQFTISPTLSTYFPLAIPHACYSEEAGNLQEYVTSWEVKVSDEMAVGLHTNDSEYKVVRPSDGWVRLSRQYKGGFTRFAGIYGIFPKAGAKIWFRNPMLLAGNKFPISYSEAPEDVEARYQKLVTNIDVEYALATSSSVAPTSDWQTTAPTYQAGRYMWQRTKTTLKDGTVVYSKPTCIQGADGRSVVSVTEQYYHSTSMTSLAGGSWSGTGTAPTPVAGKFIWTRSIVKYSSGTDTVTQAVCVTGATGDRGDDALAVSLNRQGSFRTTYKVIGDQGEVLDQPRAVQTVEGGVRGKVVVTATIRKGVTDVTERARTNGGDFRWLLNGAQIASGTSKLELGVGDHVDGVADDIEFTYDDTNAKNW